MHRISRKGIALVSGNLLPLIVLLVSDSLAVIGVGLRIAQTTSMVTGLSQLRALGEAIGGRSNRSHSGGQ